MQIYLKYFIFIIRITISMKINQQVLICDKYFKHFSKNLNLHSFLQPSESTCTILIYLRGINYNRIFLGEPKPEAFYGLPKVGNVRQKTKSRRMWWCSWKTFDSICVLICVSWRRAVRLILKSYDPLIRLVHTQSSPSKE